MPRFVDIDLSGLVMPDVVEQIDYEAILVELKGDLKARLDAAGVEYDVENLESDPAVKNLEVADYRETILRARVNNAARAVMLPHAQGADLEVLGSYYAVERMTVSPATDEDPAVMEDDERLRRRIQLAPEAFSTAGSEGAYEFHTYGVDASIKDVHVFTPQPGHVHVLPLIDTGNGAPGNPLLERVRMRLHEKILKPMTDIITVRASSISNFTVTAVLEIPPGPDSTVVLNRARAALLLYLADRHRVGRSVLMSGIIASLKVAGVEDVTVSSPSASVIVARDVTAYATAVNVTKAA